MESMKGKKITKNPSFCAMATIKFVVCHVFILSLSLFVFAVSCSYETQELKACQFNGIYLLGDSLSDTGNLIIERDWESCGHMPYGKTIHKATGRCSDGLLMIDYIAQSAGLPFLDAYLNKDGTNFSHGVNFAVGGSTAVSVEHLATMNLTAPNSNSSLFVQLQWLEAHLKDLCHNDNDYCMKKLKSALFMVEFGTNDYATAFLGGKKTMEEVKKTWVPNVVKAIAYSVERVIHYGAIQVVVIGSFPYGCEPFYLAEFHTQNHAAYDKYGCLRDYNELAIYHNILLKNALDELRKAHPTVNIVYGDLYSAFQWVLDNHLDFGFRELVTACCGKGERYNYDPNHRYYCGKGFAEFGTTSKENHSATVCANPDEFISWDGAHWTQKTQKYLAEWLIGDISRKFKCNI